MLGTGPSRDNGAYGGITLMHGTAWNKITTTDKNTQIT